MKTFREWWKEGWWSQQSSYNDCEQAWDAAMEEVEILAQGTPPEPQHGRELDKVKPLAQYLAEWIEHEHTKEEGYAAYFINIYPDSSVSLDIDCLKAALEQALDAYESTEQVKIRIERV